MLRFTEVSLEVDSLFKHIRQHVGRCVQVSRSKVTVEKSEQAPNVGRGGLQHANLCFSGWLQQVGPSAACI